MSKSTLVSRQNAQSILAKSGGRFFSVVFRKKDGTPRHMTARIGVRKGVKGLGMAYDPASRNLMTVFDVEKDAFRMINLSTVTEAIVDGTRYVFD